MKTTRWDIEENFQKALNKCLELLPEVQAIVPEKQRPFSWCIIDNSRGMMRNLINVSDDKLVSFTDDLNFAALSMQKKIKGCSVERSARLLKTAEEWQRELAGETSVQSIRAIQIDAMIQSASICRRHDGLSAMAAREIDAAAARIADCETS